MKSYQANRERLALCGPALEEINRVYDELEVNIPPHGTMEYNAGAMLLKVELKDGDKDKIDAIDEFLCVVESFEKRLSVKFSRSFAWDRQGLMAMGVWKGILIVIEQRNMGGVAIYSVTGDDGQTRNVVSPNCIKKVGLSKWDADNLIKEYHEFYE